ncbi:carbohydrate ABC transporter permease [Amnibacterium kyonggiense]|uniref:Carbohydrate ABC transporter membrane protein 1 (CUT1 family) n=1 Tax=Amnibacterium kyonggiense TaxID=595671 RepID=A0A4R7FQG2_9MICO|nr:sugar ABC transporter permease [Amnibacterium kyonggiense]TDS79983.1 carbohydrate ABC transporter membrane protein 1 (CUT1 family) [Amnibacterium kyonggiense]
MTTPAAAPLAAGPALSGRRRAGRRTRARSIGPVFIAPYVLFTVAFGLAPAIYALVLAFTDGNGAFAGFANFAKVIGDYRFFADVGHVALYLVIWLVSLLVLVVLLALLVHGIRSRRVSAVFRLLYYIPGALAGASSVLLWLFVLDPSASPVAPLLQALGFQSFNQSIAPANLPAIFAIIAFWTGAGGWIVVLFGALNNISIDVMEAARLDGANAVQIATRIQLPLMRKWIAYMSVLSLAAGTQLFVEPTLLSQASNAVVPNDYSLNQLAYQYAFAQNDFNGASAIAVLLLIVSIALSALFVWRGGLFSTEDA